MAKQPEHEHEWRWLSQEDYRERAYRIYEQRKTVDPEQPDYELSFAPVNAICDKCGKTVWAHGIYPGRTKSWEY